MVDNLDILNAAVSLVVLDDSRSADRQRLFASATLSPFSALLPSVPLPRSRSTAPHSKISCHDSKSLWFRREGGARRGYGTGFSVLGPGSVACPR